MSLLTLDGKVRPEKQGGGDDVDNGTAMTGEKTTKWNVLIALISFAVVI